MASSSPSIVSADLPRGEVPPGNRFTVDATVRQEPGGDPWLSRGGCPAPNITGTGWVTPVTLWVDGEVVDERKLCITPGAEKKASLSASVPSGGGTISLKVHRTGEYLPTGATWKDDMDRSTYDDVTTTVTTSTDARDPTMPSTSEGIMMFVQDLADRLGTTTTMISIGAVIAIGVVLFL